MINSRNRGRANRGTELLSANADVLTPLMSSLPSPIRPLFIVICGFYEHDTFIGLTLIAFSYIFPSIGLIFITTLKNA